jgi:acyl dehydratase
MDPEAARRSAFGRLIASGWHTASLMMRLFVDHYLSRVASLGSPGVDELRWLKPVFPGDRLSAGDCSGGTPPVPSRIGNHPFPVEILNQDHEVVMTLKAVNI